LIGETNTVISVETMDPQTNSKNINNGCYIKIISHIIRNISKLSPFNKFCWEPDKSPPIMMKSEMFFFIHFFILMVILDILKYKGKKIKN